MRSIQFRRTGGPEVLEVVETLKPSPGPGQVLVKAHAFGVGKPDVLLRTGVYKWMPPLPAVIGNEMSGRIEAVGSGVSDFAMGQAVLVFGTGGGRHAEYNAVSADIVTALPDTVDLDAAVCIPNYAIAWCLLYEAARAAAPRTVYVNGAAGGVGSAVIDLCRQAGFDVIAGVGSAEKCAFAKSLGATETVDYSADDIGERIKKITGGRGVDLFLDQLVGPDFGRNIPLLAPLGTIVSFNALAGMPAQDLFVEMRANLGRSPGVRCFSWHAYDAAPDERKRILGEVVALFAAGAVRPAVHTVLPMDEAVAAHRLLDAREVTGKIVLKP